MRWGLRILAVAVLVLAAMVLLDARLYHWANGVDRDTVALWAIVTELGLSSWVLIPAALIAAGAWRWRLLARSARLRTGLGTLRDRALYVFVAVAATGLTAAFFKQVLGRARPSLHAERGTHDFELLAFSHKQASFPSGHSTSIMALGVALALLMPRWRWAFLGGAAVVAFSRIPVGAHYASDVVAGAALGGFGALFLAERLAARGLVFDRTLEPTGGLAARAALRRGWRRLAGDPRGKGTPRS